MWNYECVNSGEDYLAHHGILGMKWGVRRYQNSDGTLTAAGKKRYSGSENAYSENPLNYSKRKNTKIYGSDPLTGSSKSKRNVSDMTDDELLRDNTRYALESQYKKNHPQPKSKLQKEKEAVDSAQRATQQMRDFNRTIRNSRKQSGRDLSKMSDDDLRKVINRKNLERQYRDLVYEPDRIDKGQAKLDEILSYGGAALGVASSALSIALAIRELKKG